MSRSNKQAAADRFRRNIERSNALHAEYLQERRQYENFDRYTQWQLEYLLSYFEDLYGETGYKDAIDYIMSDLAGVGISNRDRDLERAAPVITTMLPLRALQAVAEAAEVNARVLEINLSIYRCMLNRDELPEPMTEDAYIRASREASTFEECMSVVRLITDLGRTLESFVEWKIIGFLLRVMRTPAHAAGFGALQEFLETGYVTFREIPDLERFLAEIERRMTEVFHNIYG